MRRAMLTGATVIAASVILLGTGGLAAATTAPRTLSATAAASATANGATGGVHIDSVSRGARAVLGAPKAGSGYTCIIQTRRGHKVKGYRPLSVFKQGRSYSDDWMLSPYSVKHARYVSGSQTFQVEMCLTGNGHTWNDFHQWFNGGAIVLKYTVAHKLGQRWGDEVVRGSASATLNFEVSKGGVTIGGSTQVKNYGTHAGDTGRDPNLLLPRHWDKWDINRVNAFYVSSRDFSWQGTSSSEGNVGHALYEFYTGTTVNFQYGAATEIRAFCANPYCGKF
jgi:hypothetical protein